MTFPTTDFPSLDPSTIVPESEDLFIPFFNRTYESIATCVNNKDNRFFTTTVSSSASDIPNIPNFGSFIICVSGEETDAPTLTASLCKSSSDSAGSIAILGSQVGTGDWAGNSLTITSTSTNFQIAHNRAGVTGNFNIKFIGTQN